MRILILEDDPLTAFDLQLLVEDCGHEVASVCDSVASARRHLAHLPDFAFLDVDLPDGKSFDIATRLDACRVPFVFVSGSVHSELPGHLAHVPFIPKPYAHSAIRRSLGASAPAAN